MLSTPNDSTKDMPYSFVVVSKPSSLLERLSRPSLCNNHFSALIPALLPLLLLRCLRLQLQRMNASLPLQLLLQQSIYDPMSRRLHFGLERVRSDDEAEMRFARGIAYHGFVVGVQVRVIVDFEGCG